MTIDQRAEVLIQALPYIKAYNQKIVVIKYGGNAMINEDLKRAVMGDLLLLTLVGVKVVLVHGGGPEITDLLKRADGAGRQSGQGPGGLYPVHGRQGHRPVRHGRPHD